MHVSPGVSVPGIVPVEDRLGHRQPDMLGRKSLASSLRA